MRRKHTGVGVSHAETMQLDLMSCVQCIPLEVLYVNGEIAHASGNQTRTAGVEGGGGEGGEGAEQRERERESPH